jgi:hypothetical protein
MSQGYQTHGYGTVKMNNQDASIRFGTYDIDLYKPPINLVLKKKFDLIRASMKITIGQPDFTKSAAAGF